MKKNSAMYNPSIECLDIQKGGSWRKGIFFCHYLKGKNAKAMSLIDSILTARLSFKDFKRLFNKESFNLMSSCVQPEKC